MQHERLRIYKVRYYNEMVWSLDTICMEDICQFNLSDKNKVKTEMLKIQLYVLKRACGWVVLSSDREKQS